MTGAQIVQKILVKIWDSVEVENKKVESLRHTEVLGLFQAPREIDLCRWGSFPQSCEDLETEILFGFQDQNPSAMLGRILRLIWCRFVHNSILRQGHDASSISSALI